MFNIIALIITMIKLVTDFQQPKTS